MRKCAGWNAGKLADFCDQLREGGCGLVAISVTACRGVANGLQQVADSQVDVQLEDTQCNDCDFYHKRI